MRFVLIVIILSLVLITSGCVRETGELVINITERNVTENVTEAGLEEALPENVTEPEEAPPEEAPANVTENVTEEEIDLCASVICDDSITTCPDGEPVTCENTCDPETGNCTACIPDCTGHEAPEEKCTLECGACQILDEEDCVCTVKLYCDGNGICEPGIGEWPDGDDCKEFDGCDDQDDCTQDVFNPNLQECTHFDICCDDQDDCTLDVYNFTTQKCLHIWACCGDGICQNETETEESCPEDCFTEGEEPGDVVILAIDPIDELVVLEGYGIDMANWTLEDAALHIYTFPEWFMIGGKAYLHRGYGEDNGTDLYWQDDRFVWNNDHDNATLRNELGEVISTYEY